MTLAGRVAIVTGAGRGLGRAFALDLARNGAAVVVNDNATGEDGRPSAQAVVDQIVAAGGSAAASGDSVADPDAGAAIVATAIERFGRVDALVNNAGIVSTAPFDEVTPEVLRDMLAVHVTGSFALTQAAYRHMKRQGHGRVVSISSSAGLFGLEAMSAYAVAKTGLLGLTNVVAVEGAEHGILANAVLPFALTNPGRSAVHGRLPGQLGDLHPRMTADWVAPLVTYLCSQACTVSHGMWSAISGRYAVVFAGVGRGWVAPGDQPPTAEEVRAHLAEIESRDGYIVPLHLEDETIALGRQVREQG